MPRLDGTGPLGKGPMTGRKQGKCQGAGENQKPRLGLGLGRRLRSRLGKNTPNA